MSDPDPNRRAILSTMVGLVGAGAGTLPALDANASTTAEASGVSIDQLRPAADLATFTQSGAKAIARTQLEKLREIVSVKDFGARGDGIADDTAAIQAAVAHLNSIAGGTLLFPSGRYRVSAPIMLADRIVLQGVGGHAGSIVTGVHRGDIFRCDQLRFATFDRIAFAGYGCTAFRQIASTDTQYVESCEWRDCHFYGELVDCIIGNLIFARIVRNTFGYFGNVDARHRHIFSKGEKNSTSNANLIESNRFYGAKGGESVLFDSGVDLTIRGNNFEQNKATPIKLNGILNVNITQNWFEMNNGTPCEIEVSRGQHVLEGIPLFISHNHFVPAPSIREIVTVNSDAQFHADGNSGDLTGRIFTRNPVLLRSRRGNRFVGAPVTDRIIQDTGSFQVSDASGSALNVNGGPAQYHRDGDTVTCVFEVRYPANNSRAPARLTGLRYPCNSVAVGKVLSDVKGGVDVATDKGTAMLTFFAPGTLTPLSNAELAGRKLYVTLSYFTDPTP